MDVVKLEEEKKGLSEKLEALRTDVAEKERKRSREQEISALEGQIKEKAEEIDKAQETEWQAKANGVAQQMQQRLDKINANLEENRRLKAEMEELKLIFLFEVPKRLHQVSSKYSVIMQRTERVPKNVIPLMDRRPEGKVDQVVNVEIEYEESVREILVPCIPATIARCEAAGYRLRADQKIPDEPLTTDNSIYKAICDIPDILLPY